MPIKAGQPARMPFKPELLTNYSPVISPAPPLSIMTVCDEPRCCVTFSAAFVPYLLGLLEIYRYEFTFAGTTEEKDRSAGLFRDLMEVLAMCCCDGSGQLPGELTITIKHRITVEGRFEISIDNGETWQPDPEDPRYGFPEQPPYVQPGNGYQKCDAASNAIDNLKDVQADVSLKLDTGLSALELAIEIVATIIFSAFFGAVAPKLVAIVATLVHALVEMEKAAYDAMFTEEVWDKTLCAMFCTIGEDGTFNDAQFNQLLSRLNADLPGGDDPFQVSANMRSFFRVAGVAGTNNWCSMGVTANADCDDCDCEKCQSGWVLTYPGNPVFGSLVVEDTGHLRISSVAVNTNNKFYVDIRTGDENECCEYYETVIISGADGSLGSATQLCGTAFSDSNFDGGFGANCTHHIQVQCNVPFVVRLKVRPCGSS